MEKVIGTQSSITNFMIFSYEYLILETNFAVQKTWNWIVLLTAFEKQFRIEKKMIFACTYEILYSKLHKIPP